MVFNSLPFAVFFAIVCGLMALTNLNKIKALLPWPVNSLRHVLLLLASYVFYGWWNWKCCFLMLGLTVVAYVCAAAYEKDGRKLWVTLGVIAPLVILGIFKYFNFFVDSFCALLGLSRAGSLNILLPVGISFYTFQSLSYTIDVYRGKLPAEKSFVNVALYIAFFPQLVAGPIVKAGEYLPQLREDRNISLSNLEQGVQYFALGLFKKVVLADNISVFVDAVYDCPAAFHAVTVLLAVAAYSIQIYCDFSGYSDMAVGCAKCLGYDLPRNFNLPYISKNVTEFWKRWHITLTTFLRECVYFPLGGSRKGAGRTYLNILLVFLLSGFWHGAGWTFLLWGALHGLAQVAERLWGKGRDRLPAILRWALTFAFVNLAWVFFRAPDMASALALLRQAVTGGLALPRDWLVQGLYGKESAALGILLPGLKPWLNTAKFCALFLAGTVAALLPGNTIRRMDAFRPRWWRTALLSLGTAWSILSFTGVVSFIYSNF